MTAPLRILLQTTLKPTDTDDWTITRFARLTQLLQSFSDSTGQPLCHVTARDREPDANGDDPILSQLDQHDFDELWLFALDVGDGLSAADQAGIERFHQRGGGILTTRDHQDMGISMCPMQYIGALHYFHTERPNPDPDHCQPDDPHTRTIAWPNYHSGNNGDYQQITAIAPIHPLLQKPDGSVIRDFPAHPHEGGVGVPCELEDHARVIAQGLSKATGRTFNIAVAVERFIDADGYHVGRMVAESTFHHFVDYNWDVSVGCPSFVEELPGDEIAQQPERLADIYAYVRNLALWLATPSGQEDRAAGLPD